MNTVTIIATPEGNLAFTCPYNPTAVQALKDAIPSTDREWNGTSKQWIVTPNHGATLVNIAQRFYGQIVRVPAVQLNTARARTDIFKMCTWAA